MRNLSVFKTSNAVNTIAGVRVTQLVKHLAILIVSIYIYAGPGGCAV